MGKILALLLFLAPALLWAEGSEKFRSGTIDFSRDCSSSRSSKDSRGDVCAADPVNAGSATRYFDLLKEIFPGLKVDGSAGGPGKSPRVQLGQFDLSGGEGASAGDFGYLSWGDRLVILNRSAGWLAYFQAKPSLKLLDLVGIAQDQHVSFATDLGVYPVGPSGVLFWLNNWHHNAGEAFNIYNLIHAGSEKVGLAYDGPFLYSFLLPDSSECRISQSLGPVKTSGSDPDGFPRLAMRVQQEKICDRGQKSSVLGRRDFPAALAWDKSKQKYMGGSKELFRLNGCRIEGRPNCGG